MVDEAAGFAADLALPLPGSGNVAKYAVQSSRGEFHLMTKMFPTGYTWVLDATFGDVFDMIDEPSKRELREGSKSPLKALQMWERAFRGH